jgi:diguanylate cyclase (GGDEF)-like protein
VDEHPPFLSTLPASQGEHRAALAVVLASITVFLATAPFARTPLPPVPAFIAIYESALVITDLMTAVFLFGQFNILRSPPLLPLACGYLFTAFLATAHALTFPGLFSPTGLLGAGPQSTAWLYMFWHAGFPLLVIAYTRLHCPAHAPHEQYEESPRRVSAYAAIVASVAAVLAVACALTLLATAGQDALPAIMLGNRYTPAMVVVVSSVWLLSLVALLAVWRHRPHSVLDLWVMVVLCAWMFDIGLSAVLNAGRFDLGFYAGRIYGLFATSFVLVMLTLDHSRLYSRLIETHKSERRKAVELQRLSTVAALTGIANRRAFEAALDQEWRRTMRHYTPLCLLLIDADFFKRFNDTYGHVAGDECLRAIAKVLAGNARRAGEVAARYGGEEFAVLLPHAELDDARRVGERICSEVRALAIPHAGSTAAPHVTVSVGVASALLAVGSQAETLGPNCVELKNPRARPTLLVELADRALYAAKTSGRNRVFAAGLDDASGAAAAQPAA